MGASGRAACWHRVPAAPVQAPRQAGAWTSAFHRPSGLCSACAEAGEFGPGKITVSQDAYSLTIALLSPLAYLTLTPKLTAQRRHLDSIACGSGVTAGGLVVYPDIFIKTLIKQKLICGIVFEF